MKQNALRLPDTNVRPVCVGDIYALGRHRLMCGDATSKVDVATLFAEQKPTLIVTSPPYAKQRNYDRPIPCWDSLMMQALNGHAFASNVQILANLGIIHVKGQWLPYWHNWLLQMQKVGWKYFSQYVWNKQISAPGRFEGRMTPSHELIHHLNTQAVKINHWQECTFHGQSERFCAGLKRRNGLSQKEFRRPVNKHKPPSSVINLPPVTRWEASGHPAQMPVSLAAYLLRSWKQPLCLAYDPFGGSGTTLLACEQEQVAGMAMEISPAYVQLAINRWNKAHPHQTAKPLQ